jgi:replicative DNA helicase
MAKELKEKVEKAISLLPPQNADAEQSLLGAILLDKDAIIKIADILTGDDFYREDNKEIFEAMLTLFEKRAPIDVVTVTDELDKSKKLKDIGGASYLSSLVNGVPSSAHIVKYAEIIRHKSLLRRLIRAGGTITELGFKEDEEVDGILDQAQSTLFAVSQRFSRDNFVAIKSVLEDSFERIDLLHKNKDALRGVPSGFRDLDNLLSGLQPSDLVIVAARPSMGKTSFVLNVAQYVATQVKIPVGFFSLEQSKEQIVDRLLSMQAGVDSWKLRTGNLGEDDFPKLGYAMGILAEAPLFIDDTPMMSVMEIRAKARRLQMEHGLGLIIIDYLQLMEGRGGSGGDNRVQEVSQISRGLKALGRELNVPVIALSQLSRAVEQRDKKIPQLADLRESGSIEQDADVVMFIYRDEYYNKETDKKNIAEILVRKHRNGPTGDVKLFFQASQTKFANLDVAHDSPPLE